MKTTTDKLADALRDLLAGREGPDIGPFLAKMDRAREALADYDAQRAQPAATSDHTPEPWAAYDLDGSTPYIGNKAANGRPGWEHETIADLFRDMDDGTSVVGAMNEPYPNAAANARRIVACVNACAGIPTDKLEQLTPANVSDALRPFLYGY